MRKFHIRNQQALKLLIIYFFNLKYAYALNMIATIIIQVRGNRIVLMK